MAKREVTRRVWRGRSTKSRQGRGVTEKELSDQIIEAIELILPGDRYFLEETIKDHQDSKKRSGWKKQFQRRK